MITDPRIVHDPATIQADFQSTLPRIQNQARLKGEVSDAIAALLDTSGMTQKALAEAMGTRPSNVSQMLSGNMNLTLERLADVFMAFGRSIHITLGTCHDEATSPQDLLGEVFGQFYPKQEPFSSLASPNFGQDVFHHIEHHPITLGSRPLIKPDAQATWVPIVPDKGGKAA